MTPEPRVPTMQPAKIAEALERLRDHGFINGWERAGRYWKVDAPGERGWQTQTQISAWIDGANAMGAG